MTVGVDNAPNLVGEFRAFGVGNARIKVEGLFLCLQCESDLFLYRERSTAIIDKI